MKRELRGRPRSWPDWGQSAPQVASPLRRAGRAAAVFVTPLLVLVPVAVLGLPPVALASVALIYIAAAVVWVRRQGSMALAAAGAGPSHGDEAARARNIVEGLASELGLGAPRLLVMEGAPNALVVTTPRPTIALSRSLLHDYSRTELEAIAAHCLVRLASHQIEAAQLAVALGRFGGGLAGVVGLGDDITAAALTRYPPALAKALSKAGSYRGRFAPLYFAADGAGHLSAEERIESLLDL